MDGRHTHTSDTTLPYKGDHSRNRVCSGSKRQRQRERDLYGVHRTRPFYLQTCRATTPMSMWGDNNEWNRCWQHLNGPMFLSEADVV